MFYNYGSGYSYYEEDDGGGLYDRRDSKRRCLSNNYNGGSMEMGMGPPPHAFQMLQVSHKRTHIIDIFLRHSIERIPESDSNLIGFNMA